MQEIKQLAQDHRASKWSSQDLNLDSLAPSVNRAISRWWEFLFLIFCIFLY